MRVSAIALIVIITWAAPVAAQSGGHIGLYSDDAGNCCVLNETLNVVNYVYVVHSSASEAQASQFRVVNAWVGPSVGVVTYASFVVGNIYEGVIVTYGGCQSLPFLVATLSFTPTYASPPESIPLWVTADPDVPSGKIEVLDCEGDVSYGTGGELRLNFFNDPPPGCEGCIETPAESSTWGKVKALYR